MKYYLLGIKGSGMSALALILNDLKYKVIGYDDDDSPKYTEELLINRGIKIYYDQSYSLTDEVVIYSPALANLHPEIRRTQAKGLKILLYNEMIGELTKKYETIAIAGCHGKTTTTALLAHLLTKIKDAKKANYLIGDGTGYANKNNTRFLIEACEYRRHFLYYYPRYTIITNVELEHVDYYKDLDDVKDAYQSLVNQTKKMIIANGDDEHLRQLKINKEVIYYGVNDDNDIIAKNIVLKTNGSSFDVYAKDQFLGHVELPLLGRHMILNALAVITFCYVDNLDMKEVLKYLKTFKGAKKRFKEKVFNDIITIDDYAHHPTELKVTIESARQKYPDKKIIALYSPNTYSRTKAMAQAEASALNLADLAYVTDILADREKAEDWPGISSELIINLLNNGDHISFDSVDKLLSHRNAVLLFMSCKDIYKLQTRYEQLLKEKLKEDNLLFKERNDKMLKGTKTEENLLIAFAGESQARNRYSMYASIAKKEGYVQISEIFLRTAANEYEHAKLFYRKLLGNEVKMEASYPAGVIGDTLANLKAAVNGEGDEADHLYPEFARIAKEEGFDEISLLFSNIANIEKHHQQRYLKLAKNIEKKQVFKRDEEREWVCLECGNIHYGKEAPLECPVCAHPRAYYQLHVEDY